MGKNTEVEIEPLGDGVAIHLPFRKLGGAKRIGWLLIALGSFVTLFMLGWIATPVFWGIDILRKGELFGWLFIAFGSLGFAGLYHSVKFLTAGVAILNDRIHCTVTVNDTHVVNREQFGWFSHKFKFNRSEIDQLYVVPVSSVSVSRHSNAEVGDASGILEFLFGDSHHQQFTITPKKLGGKLIAAAYPQDLLVEVANAIAAELNRNQTSAVTIVREPHADRALASSSATVSVSSLSEADVAREIKEEAINLPDNSTLEVVEDDGGSLVFKVPEKTLMRGSGGLFLFSIVWNSFLLFMSFAAIGGMANGGAWGAIPILGAFWAVGIGMLVGAIYMARQRAMIGVKDGLLFIERRTIFGTKWTEFSADEIDTIEMAHANMEVNGKPVMNLSITPNDGKPVKMLSHLDDQELRWLAQKLRRSLGVKAQNNRLAVGNFDLAEPLAPLESSDVAARQSGNQTFIDVPPKSFAGSNMLWGMGLALVSLSFPSAIGAIFFLGAGFELLMFAGFLTVIGILMLGAHRFVTTRHGQIAVSDESIEIRIRGFLCNRNLALDKPEVLSVDVEDSGVKINNQSMYCLKIKGTAGRSLSMMTGRKNEELVHVARLIHQQLKLSPPTVSP